MKTDTLARDIMTRRLVTLRPETHVFEGVSCLLKHDITGAPVVDPANNYLGVFSEKCCMSVLTLTAQSANEGDARLARQLHAKDVMVTRLFTLKADQDVFDVIGLLLKHQISGAPVLDDQGTFLGVFSEKTSMQVLVSAAMDQLPGAQVEAFMNRDEQRIIDEQLGLVAIAQIFIDTSLRRLAVVREGKLLGQICRGDVLRAEHHLSMYVRDPEQTVVKNSWTIPRSDAAEEVEPPEWPTPEVSSFMDRRARTITEETDVLEIARIFLDTPYRRLPVLRDGKLVGQVSRGDLLRAIHSALAMAPEARNKWPLYLSAVTSPDKAPIY